MRVGYCNKLLKTFSEKHLEALNDNCICDYIRATKDDLCQLFTDDACCFICLDDFVKQPPMHLGCMCKRLAHLECASKWHIPRTRELVLQSLTDDLAVESFLVCLCDTCKKPINQHFLRILQLRQELERQKVDWTFTIRKRTVYIVLVIYSLIILSIVILWIVRIYRF